MLPWRLIDDFFVFGLLVLVCWLCTLISGVVTFRSVVKLCSKAVLFSVRKMF